jgi:hypothetical protein
MRGRVSLRTASRVSRVVGVALLGVLGVGTWVALAAGSFGTPSLAASPSASPTNSTTETFTFSTSQTAGYQCSMAAGANSTPLFTACASPKSYSGLAEGSYTFKVRAVDSKGNLSGIAFYGWTVDLTPPPTPTITSKPASLSTSSSASFGFSDADSGVSYQCKLDAGSYAACSNPATFTVADGQHTLAVQAKDAAGNVSSGAASYSWTVDATPPPKPTLTGPNNKSDSTAATFTFTDSEANVSWKCQLDGGGYTNCASPKTYTLLTPGTHVFDVEPIDQAGNVGPFNEWKWTINGVSGSGQSFTISINGTLSKLYPGGPTDALNLKLTNPNSVTIYVTSLTVALSGVTKAPNVTMPCSASSDFTLTQLGAGANLATNPIAVPANSSTTLSAAGLSTYLPTVAMKDTSVLQDGCKNATLNFTFSGNAQS